MRTDEIIQGLKYNAKKHENDRVFTGQLNITSMCKDLIPKMEQLKAYEDAEEQGLLFRSPCKVGDDIYSIPSETNYRLNVLSKHEENNRVYHQKVARISFTKNGWYVECDKDIEYGTDRICIEQHFGITWFLTKEEAEQKLTKMKEGAV